jgi:uncharacterized membrane protein HdeD (DUF308 family)
MRSRVGDHWSWLLGLGIITLLAGVAVLAWPGPTLLAVLGIPAGLIVLVYPAVSLLTLAVVLGIWLLVQGGMQIALAFQARSPATRYARVAGCP